MSSSLWRETATSHGMVDNGLTPPLTRNRDVVIPYLKLRRPRANARAMLPNPKTKAKISPKASRSRLNSNVTAASCMVKLQLRDAKTAT